MPMLEHLRCDLAAVIRGLKSSRSLLVVATLTLAVAIGTNVAMFGLVDRALLSPARLISDPGSLFAVGFEREGTDGRPQRMTTTSYVAFKTLRTEVPAIDGAAASQTGPTSVVIDSEQVPAATMLVSAGYFELLGALPRVGQVAMDGSSAVISHGFWMSAFGGDPAVLGRRISVRGVEFQVGAIMPKGFSGHAPSTVDVWFPIEPVMSGTPGWDGPFRNIVTVIARVPAADVAAASSQASAALERRVILQPLAGSGIGAQERRIAFWLAGVSALVLVIGLANAGTLLLVRAARRRREFAIRVALGAGRSRLIRQAAGESAVVALVSAVAAILFGTGLDDAVRRVLLPGVIERAATDPQAVAAALATGLAAGLVAFGAAVGHLPRGSRPGDLTQARPRALAQKVFLVLQTSLSVVLLVGAGMFGRSLYALLDQDFGFTTDRVVLVDFEQGPGSLSGQNEVFTSALERVRALPGVEAATFYQSMPFGSFHVPPIAVPGRAELPQVGEQLPFLIAATPTFLQILGIRIVEGRAFTPADENGAPVVIVNETMARGVWPGESAVGKCIRIGFDPDFDPEFASGPPTPSAAVPCREVVGVARDVRQRSVVPEGNEARLMQYYVPFSQIPPPPAAVGQGPGIAGLLVKTRAGSSLTNETLRRVLVNGRPDLPPARVRSYASLLEHQVRPWELGTKLLTLFGVLAVVIAAVGLYAAFAHSVLLRRREMAIRLALGATPGAVRALVFRDAIVLTLTAAAAGCLAGILAGRSLQALLYGIVPADPIVLGCAMLVMLGVAVGATLLPARTASLADPNTLLRAE